MTKNFYSISAGESLRAVNSSRQGLSNSESALRLEKEGLNELAAPPRPSRLKMFFAQFKDVMTIILLIAAIISMVIAIVSKSPAELIDGLIILAIVFSNAFIGFWQEQKAQKSMAELQKLTQPEALVVREGVVQKVLSKNLSVGDILVLESGNIVPADARLLESVALKCDESALTGESVPVEKDAKAVLPAKTPLADQKNMVFSGSVISAGRGLGVVTAVGYNSQIGKIASMLSSSETPITPLQKATKALAKIITYIVLSVCLITFFIELFSGVSTPLDALLTAVALAVAAIPESLPAVITIIISLGILRLAKKKAIIKHLHALETLGCCEVICSDKTGTLTQNKMEVQTLFCGGKTIEEKSFAFKSNEEKKMMEIMLLCESVEEGKKGWVGDPTELALVHFAEQKANLSRKKLLHQKDFLDEIPFDSNRKLMSSVWAFGAEIEVLTKGAVDELLERCSLIEIGGVVQPILPSHKEKILRANKEMASGAKRVLAFAYKPLKRNFAKSALEENLIFVGLAGMFDPPRKEVYRAVNKCKRAGVKPIMITGDHKSTAFAVAKKIGITEHPFEVITGAEIDTLSERAFEEIISKKCVFARVSPENKVRIVEAFKKKGLLVAMTGDGVNDAPSIKKAHVGIGMGQSGTDVTKEAADVIITDDNFATIVAGIEEGRKTYANIKKTVQFLLTANLAEIIAIFLATIFMPELVFLTPVQILFVNLVSDTLPAIALGVEPAEKDLMSRPPRNVKEGLLEGDIWKKMVLIGAFQGLVMLGAFLFGLCVYSSPLIATTMAFYALNVVQFFYFISMRTNDSIWENPITKNRLAVWAVGVCFGFVALVALTPLGTLFGLVSVPLGGWLAIGLGCVATFIFSEFVKKLKFKKPRNKKLA